MTPEDAYRAFSLNDDEIALAQAITKAERPARIAAEEARTSCVALIHTRASQIEERLEQDEFNRGYDVEFDQSPIL